MTGSGAQSIYRLTLYITGATVRSLQAVANVRELLNLELPGRHVLEVVDLYRWPERARGAQIVACPTLVRHEPQPARYAIGDMSRLDAVRAAIGAAA